MSTTGGRGRGRPDPVGLGQLRRVSVDRLPDLVAQQIRDLIVSEDLAENSRLPSERDMAERFGASRPTVSQALRTLSLMGLVEIRPGSGAYVVRRPDRSITASMTLMLDLDRQSLTHLADLRLWLETLGVREAVAAAGAAGTGPLRTALQRLGESTGSTSGWIAADTVFHATAVRLSANPFLASIYESVHTAVLSYEYEPWVRDDTVPSWLRPGEADAVMALHEPILTALEQADETAAVRAVRRHHEVMVHHLDLASRDHLR